MAIVRRETNVLFMQHHNVFVNKSIISSVAQRFHVLKCPLGNKNRTDAAPVCLSLGWSAINSVCVNDDILPSVQNFLTKGSRLYVLNSFVRRYEGGQLAEA